MPTVEFENGTRIEFEREPTDQDIEEVAQQFGIQPPASLDIQQSIIPPSMPPSPRFGQKATRTVEKIGDFLGLGALGRGLGLTAFQLTPEYKRLQKNLETGQITPEEFERITTEGITPRQIVGSGAQTALTAITPGLKVPIGVGGKALQAGGITAGLTGAKSFGEGKQPQEIARDAFIGGLSGIVVQGAFSGIATLGKSLTSKIPERLYNSALRVTQKINQAEKSPSKFLIDKGIFGTSGSILKTANANISRLNNQINQNLSKSPSIINSSEVIDEVSQQLKKQFGLSLTDQERAEIINRLPIGVLREKTTIAVNEANQLRKELDRMLGEAFFLTERQAPAVKEATGATANVLRNRIKTLAPETKKLFSDESNFIRTRNLLVRKLAQIDRNFDIGLRDVLIGSVVGLGGEGSPGERIGRGIGAVVARKALTSTFAQTTSANILNRLGQIINRLPTDAAGRISKTTLTNALKNLISNK